MSGDWAAVAAISRASPTSGGDIRVSVIADHSASDRHDVVVRSLDANCSQEHCHYFRTSGLNYRNQQQNPSELNLLTCGNPLQVSSVIR
ncbi:hypothetical protein [Gordonia sp. CPCC 205333]|uniref:hypothetical protein n=1 Tax=Gordonia sp. CPCC 205333 TaxID=3140790 RepID=UPI003AF37A93